ncbi:MAG TPA: class I SAM-dependent methyltransferase [Vicinamibacterales bacterium]|nr:class I SAM-dependent methyltransferase [Vicinamibacterales bacterium]
MLWRDYAHLESVKSQRAVDAAGNPLPWYTYPAIEFLRQLDFSDKTVFEYGSGMSTLFWAGKAKRVVSVEDDEQWCGTLRNLIPANAELIYEPDLANFPGVISSRGEFDIIVVDGPARGRTRLKCCRAAFPQLRDGGLIILDNSDWLPESSKCLRDYGLLEVDMTGFAPICGHVQTTSLFFHRAFAVPPVNGRQPVPGQGARLGDWERPFVAADGACIECDGEAYRAVTTDRTVTFGANGGARTFRLLSYLSGDNSRRIVILDLARDRVLLAGHDPAQHGRAHRSVDQEIEMLAGFTYDEFEQFVNRHDNRRYML